MNQKTFFLVAGVVFGLIALGHVLRIVLGWSIVIQDLSVRCGQAGARGSSNVSGEKITPRRRVRRLLIKKNTVGTRKEKAGLQGPAFVRYIKFASLGPATQAVAMRFEPAQDFVFIEADVPSVSIAG
jgi:hypothetical protein